MNRIGAIVQARMSSKRLPGKVLCRVGEKPLLQYIVERLKHSGYLNAIVIATSEDESDQPIEEFCDSLHIHCFRGSLHDVAGRFSALLDRYPFDAFIRINGDSPLIDQRLIDAGIDHFTHKHVHLVTNLLPRTYPKGQSIEVVRSDIFIEAYQMMETEDEKEHVTKYFYHRKEDYKIFNFRAREDYSHIQLSVDTREDMAKFASIVGAMKKSHWEYSLEEILELNARVVDSL